MKFPAPKSTSVVLRFTRRLSKTVKLFFHITAAATGLLLLYGVVYAMEDMTTRIPISPLRDLGITTLLMLPWTMLFCSGLDDFGAVTRQGWVFWAGVTLALAFLYYFERSTSSSIAAKIAMPLLATAGGLMPHVIRRIRLLFTVFSFAAGVAGVVVFYDALTSYFSGSTFASKVIAFVVFTL